MFYFNKIYIKNAQVLLSTGEKSIQDQETIEDEAKTGRKKKEKRKLISKNCDISSIRLH